MQLCVTLVFQLDINSSQDHKLCMIALFSAAEGGNGMQGRVKTPIIFCHFLSESVILKGKT